MQYPIESERKMKQFKADVNTLDANGFTVATTSSVIEATGHGHAANRAAAQVLKTWVGYTITQTDLFKDFGRHYEVHKDGAAVLSVFITAHK